jgi:wobble nucleotide-excising tRNase
MLRRFQRISGVGCFADCRAPQVQFEHMSLVYGENCYGKSTLCDILRSLGDNAPDYVADRATVPRTAHGSQEIQVSFALPGQTQESVFAFRRGTWTPDIQGSLRLDVFDTDFIHRNIFTGLSIQRANHENMTRFVLGESGVATAHRISEINEELRALNRRLRDAESNVFVGVQDLPAFLAMDVQQGPEEIEANIATLLTQLESERRLASDADAARSRPEPGLFTMPGALGGLPQRVAELLAATFDQAHREAESRLQDHLLNHTQNSQHARRWVQQGVTLIAEDECPFCGRALEGDAAALIAAYQNVFNQAFDRFTRDIASGLDEAQRVFAAAACAELRLLMEQNRRALDAYPEFRQRQDAQQHFNTAQEAVTNVLARLDGWTHDFSRLSEGLTASVQRKKENIHVGMPPWCEAAALAPFEALSRAVEDHNRSLRQVLDSIARFKAGLGVEQSTERIRIMEAQVARFRLEKKRIELGRASSEYVALSGQRRTLEQEVARLQEQLATEQTSFLERYFETINTLFTRLGSRRFSIAAEQSRRGNMPTIQLRVAFNGVPITQNRVRTFFSESDRRALALAVFWARLQTRDAKEQNRTVVVLDDPVTSFDDGRIDRTIRLIEAELPRLRQVIVLSHYPEYLKTFFTRANGQDEHPLLACLYQDDRGTQMRRADPLDFTETDHQRAYRRIAGFIARQHAEDVLSDLRVFLETEVRSRYYRAICENDLRGHQFAALLTELTSIGAMSTETRDAVDQLRLTLNTDHHIWTNRSHEENIGIAEDVVRCAYDQL